MTATVAVIQLPGSNCEYETARAVVAAGGSAEIVRWNVPAGRLAGFCAYIIVGGFSYQDRIRAGAVAARLPIMDVIASRAGEGAPVLGICNGAQVLVECGLVPSIERGRLEVVLAPNVMPGRDGYFSRWVLLGPGPAASRCLFTRGIPRPFPCPMAHGEGCFTTRDAEVALRLPEFVALEYRQPDGAPAESFPWNPNGSLASAAGITNPAGNVLALMPHPERAAIAAQVPASFGMTDTDPEAAGPGLGLFRALVRACEDA